MTLKRKPIMKVNRYTNPFTQLVAAFNNYQAYRNDPKLAEAAKRHEKAFHAAFNEAAALMRRMTEAMDVLGDVGAEAQAEPMMRLVSQNAAETVRWNNGQYAEAATAAGGVLVIKQEAA